MKITRAALLGELTGGLTSAFVALPSSMAWGMLVFAPLGEKFISQGVMAGLYASLIIGLVTSLISVMPGMQFSPSPAPSILFASMAAHLAATELFGAATEPNMPLLLGTLFLTTLLAGGIQLFFGVARVGTLVKFIPHPVIAGFINATAILIILSQTWSFFGLQRGKSLLDLLPALPNLQPLTLLIGLVTAITIWFAPRITKKIPGAILGMLVGTLLYHLLATMGYAL